MELENYKNGNVISLSLTNFQTFKSSKITFSSSLNFIIGPNGSGKSTISNALSLLFCGTQKTIGKSKNLKDFIKFGEHSSQIEAEIFYNNNIIKIGRGISITNNYWYLNEKIVKKSEYEEFVDKLKINVNNLCQYLPQEKVSEFCRMSNEELLHSTLLSLNREDLLEKIQVLNETEIKLNDTKMRESSLRKQKEELQLLVNKNLVDLEKIEKREIKMNDIEMMESKKIWIEYDNLSKEYKRLDQAIKILEKNKEDNEKEIEDLKLKIEIIENNPNNLLLKDKIKETNLFDEKLVKIKEEIRSLKQASSLLDIDLEHLEKKREQKKVNRERLKQEIESNKEDSEKIKMSILEKKDFFYFEEEDFCIKRIKCDFEGVHEELENSNGRGNCGDRRHDGEEYGSRRHDGKEYGSRRHDGEEYDDNFNNNYNNNYSNTFYNNNYSNSNFEEIILQSKNIDNLFVKFNKTKINKLEDEKYNLKNKSNEIKQKSFDINLEVNNLENEKKKFNEAGERRLEQLKKYSYDTYKGVVWLREHKNQFRDEIIEPPFLNLSISNPNFINEVEIFLNFHALTSFICKNQSDFEKISKILKDNMNLAVNIVENIRHPPKDQYNIQKVKDLGFDGLVIDFIEAREEVINFLKASCHLNNIPITKKNINDKFIFENTTFKRMAANNKYIEIKRSKYNPKDFVIISLVVKPKNLFQYKIDTSEIEKRLLECNKIRKDLNEELSKIHQKLEKIDYDLKKQYEANKEHTNQIMKIKNSINNYKVIIEQIKTMNIELKKSEETTDLKNIEKDILIKRRAIDTNLDKLNTKLIDFLKNEEYLFNLKNIVFLHREIKVEAGKLQLLLNSKNMLERQSYIIESNINEHEQKKEKMKPEIINKKNILKDKTYTKEEMSRFPDTIEQINDKIRLEKAKLKFCDVNTSIKSEYSINKSNLDKLLETIENIEINKNQYTKNLVDEKVNLATEITKLINKINEEFKSLFIKIKCEGKIEFDFVDKLPEQWKINIFVKFREKEKLEKLSSFRQSGGEKSVSTILFLLALQKLDSAPFRLVDEINQGMDKYNEKLILEILFDLCEKDKNTQFFIISPKLVEGLTYNTSMRVICLFSDQCQRTKDTFYRQLC